MGSGGLDRTGAIVAEIEKRVRVGIVGVDLRGAEMCVGPRIGSDAG